jgi:hypothetical protein
VRSTSAVDLPGAVVAVGRPVPLEDAGHVVDEHRVLVSVVLRFGEDERQELLVAEFRQRPVVRLEVGGAGGDVGPGIGVVAPRWGVDGD